MINFSLPYIIDKTVPYGYKISIFDNGLLFEGEFYKILNREIVKSDTKSEFLSYDEYTGTNNLKIRSERKLNALFIPYAISVLAKPVANEIQAIFSKIQTGISDIRAVSSGNIMGISKIQEQVDKVNGQVQNLETILDKLQRLFHGDFAVIPETIIDFLLGIIPIPKIPGIVEIIICLAQVGILIMFFVYLFSKKRVYYFAGTSKRLAIPMNTLTENEYFTICGLTNDIMKERGK